MSAALLSLTLGLGLTVGLEPAPATEAPPTSPTSPPATTATSAEAPAGESMPLEPMPAPEPPAPAVEVEITAPAADAAPAPTAAPVEGPPFYTSADEAALRQRYGLDPAPPTTVRTARWRCLVADPTCSFNVEINATSAYAYRIQQGSPVDESSLYRWSSARSQYDIWLNLPGAVETHGGFRYTRLSVGPKGGLIVSDSKTVWGNLGLALRYWFGRGRWAPTLEVTSAMTFRLATSDYVNADGMINTRRSPVGVTADIGVGLGGFGALIFGAQYDSPLAREDVTEAARVWPAGMVFVGFRGNIVWGAPAALAVGTTALSQKVEAPARP